jgi:hypothetical protein
VPRNVLQRGTDRSFGRAPHNSPILREVGIVAAPGTFGRAFRTFHGLFRPPAA